MKDFRSVLKSYNLQKHKSKFSHTRIILQMHVLFWSHHPNLHLNVYSVVLKAQCAPTHQGIKKDWS